MSWPPSPVPARSGARRRAGVTLLRALVLTLVTVLMAGCATFPDTGPRVWRDKPDNNGPLAAPPKLPEESPDRGKAPPDAPPKQPAPPTGCDDPDPLVVATCLDPVSAIATLPDGQSALVAQRATGRILRVEKGKPSQPIATVSVDAASGGLKGLVLSPSYGEDRLLYAYAATASDQRVVRVTPDGLTVPVLTGIPRTPGNDSGSLAVSKDGALVVATGSEGSAQSPGSLGGKILKIDTFGKPFRGNPDPQSPIFSAGLHAPGGLCAAPDSDAMWVTDRTPDRDALFKIIPGQLAQPAWNWPDKPGVAGCVAQPDALAVAQRGASSLFVLPKQHESDNFTGTPSTALVGTYGRISAATLGPLGIVWLGTENKGRSGPVALSDDRVIKLPLIGGSSSGAGPD